MFSEKKRILCIGAHPDDIVLGAGGTIARLTSLPHSRRPIIYCVTLSRNIEKSGQECLPQEDHIAIRTLNVKEDLIFILDFRTRYFSYQRQEICDALNHLHEEIAPDLIITHAASDIHQDHEVVFKESKRVFRKISLMTFEVGRSQDKFRPSHFVGISQNHLDIKTKALACYTTYTSKNYMDPDKVRSRAVMRAEQLEWPYAEAFESISIDPLE